MSGPIKRLSPRTFKEYRRALAAFPLTLAHDVAQRSAPVVTKLAQSAYDGGQNVYGDPRPEGVNGPLTLKRTGTTRKLVQFVSNGRIVRCVLGTKYARFLIGKYGILPNGNAAIPRAWGEEIARITRESSVPL